MNDIIRELADKAREYAEWSTPQGLEWFDNFKEQFAELIVRECIQNIRDNMKIAKVDTLGDKDLFLETLRTSGHFYITELERHFGVEE
jgi:hypothetical protein